jgi:hypothetical protein
MNEQRGGEGGTFGASSETPGPDGETAEPDESAVVEIPIGMPLTEEELRRLKAAAEEAAEPEAAQEDPDTC